MAGYVVRIHCKDADGWHEYTLFDPANYTRNVADLKLKKENGAVDSLTGTVYPRTYDSSGYDVQYAAVRIGSWLEVFDGEYNADNSTRIYKGYIIALETGMNASGIVYKKFTAEGAMGWLNDTTYSFGFASAYNSANNPSDPWYSYCQDLHPYSSNVVFYKRNNTERVSSGDWARYILAVHNSQQSRKVTVGTMPTKKIYIGETDGQNVRDAMNAIVDAVGGWWNVDYTTANPTISWEKVSRSSAVSKGQIKLGENMLSISETVDASQIVNNVRVYGESFTEYVAGHDVYTSAGRLIPSDYGISGTGWDGWNLKDQDSIDLYGDCSGTFVVDGLFSTDGAHNREDARYGIEQKHADAVKSRAEDYIAEMKEPKVSLKVQALDMSRIDSSYSAFVINEWWTVKNTYTGVDGKYRIIAQCIDIVEPHRSTVTLGNTKRSAIRAITRATQGRTDNTAVARKAKSDNNTDAKRPVVTVGADYERQGSTFRQVKIEV